VAETLIWLAPLSPWIALGVLAAVVLWYGAFLWREDRKTR